MGKSIFRQNSECIGNKSKNRQMGLHQTKKLLYRKGKNPYNEETSYKMQENICKL
jgi:hypothetical protein